MPDRTSLALKLSNPHDMFEALSSCIWLWALPIHYCKLIWRGRGTLYKLLVFMRMMSLGSVSRFVYDVIISWHPSFSRCGVLLAPIFWGWQVLTFVLHFCYNLCGHLSVTCLLFVWVELFMQYLWFYLLLSEMEESSFYQFSYLLDLLFFSSTVI